MAKFPTVSFIVCTYNDKVLVKKCIDSILFQDYSGKFEVICIDDKSSDGTYELLKDYDSKIRLFTNKIRYAEGFGAGKFQGYKKAKGGIIIFLDQDNELIGKNWLTEFVKPFVLEKNIIGAPCIMQVREEDNITNRYLSYIGTDPFAIERSFEGRFVLGKLKLEDKGGYWTYEIPKDDILCTGGNCFGVFKKNLDLINGYSYDVEMIYEFVHNGINKIAIPKNTRVHHLTINSLWDFITKRYKWGKRYAVADLKNSKRKYSWVPSSFNEWIKFFVFVFLNLIIITRLFRGIWNSFKYKDIAWLLHPFMMFYITVVYGVLGAYMAVRGSKQISL